MRRLKMPMDKVEFVCKEIHASVVKNWSKIAAQEYPPVPGQLSASKKELAKRMHHYILKLQAWNLMNAWRNTFGPDAPSDELVRILKLMNSNDREDKLYQKVFQLKYTANMFKVWWVPINKLQKLPYLYYYKIYLCVLLVIIYHFRIILFLLFFFFFETKQIKHFRRNAVPVEKKFLFILFCYLIQKLIMIFFNIS